MSLQYKVIINDTKPTEQIQGTLWLHKTSGILFIAIDDYRQMASSETSLSSLIDEIKWMNTIESSTAPVAPAVCQIWIQASTTVWIYLDKWIQICGRV
jgi:hypothetical protein